MSREIEEVITEEEREQARQNTLQVIKNKYLQYKAEYLTAKALNNTQRMAEMARMMDEANTSYLAVKEGL